MMLLWTAVAVMTGLAVLVVLVPLSRARAEAAHAAAYDSAVYRDQLREIERDLERGLIAPAEAEAARTEVSRRLLAASAEADTPAATTSTARRRIAAVVALVFVPALALGSYLVLGSPQLPAQPLAQRLSAPDDQQDVAVLVRRIELHLQQHPTDGRGWDVLGPVYMRMARYQDAATAFSNAIRLEGGTADRHASLGEALVAVGGGVVTADAKAAFQAAIAADRASPRARFWMARTTEQDGDTVAALAQMRTLLTDSPPEAPWRPYVEAEIARLSAARQPAGGTPAAASPSAAPAPAPAPGPSADDVAAAAAMPAEQRVAMIRGMVDRLAERLKETPQDRDGWVRLVRAYAVLGEPARARGAAEDARRALAGTPDGAAVIDALVRDLGLAERGS